MARSERFENERKTFDVMRVEALHKRENNGSKAFIRDCGGWVLFGPRDVRGDAKRFMFCLQKLKNQKTPRIRVGCRYYTLAQAWKHWSFKAKTGRTTRRDRYGYTGRKNEGQQAIAIIRLMLLQAQAYGLISKWEPVPKFDSSLLKPKRKT